MWTGDETARWFCEQDVVCEFEPSVLHVVLLLLKKITYKVDKTNGTDRLCAQTRHGRTSVVSLSYV